MTPLCDDTLRYLYKLRKAANKGASASDISKLAEVFSVTRNHMIIECGALEQSELIDWDRTPGGSVRISAGGLKYCVSILDLEGI